MHYMHIFRSELHNFKFILIRIIIFVQQKRPLCTVKNNNGYEVNN